MLWASDRKPQLFEGCAPESSDVGLRVVGPESAFLPDLNRYLGTRIAYAFLPVPLAAAAVCHSVESRRRPLARRALMLARHLATARSNGSTRSPATAVKFCGDLLP